MLRVLIDTSPLQNANAIRGVGVYTRFLVAELQKRSDIELVTEQAQADIIHYPFFDLFFSTLPLWPALRFSFFKKQKPKVCVTVHDVIPLLFPKEYKVGVKGRLRFWKQRLALQHVDAVFTDSIASQKDIVKYMGIPEEKIHVIYLAGNPEIHTVSETEQERVRRAYKLPQQYLLYVGDINYNKNIPQLIKMMKFLPDEVSLVCVGKNFVPQEIEEWRAIEVQMAMSDVGQRVHFITEIAGEANEELSALYSGALAYVQASLYEGFGLPLLEAMQCETSVVSTANSSLIEVGGEYVQFVPSGKTDAESLAETVKEVLSWSAQKRKESVKAAGKWAAQFSWKKTAAETVQCYKNLRTQ